MFLNKVAVKHYKSLDSVVVDFSPITVVVGPNGVGKSNFVDALKFFRDIARDGLDHAVIGREGIDRIRQTYKSRPYNISLDFELTTRSDDLSETRPASYQIVLSSKEGDYRVESEDARYFQTVYEPADEEDSSTFTIDLVQQSFERRKDGELRINAKTYDKKVRPDVIALGQTIDFDDLGGPIASFARDWRFCSLYPNTLRKLSPPVREVGLMEDGSNWASVVRTLKRNKSGRQALERIAEVMKSAVAGYRDISVEAAGSYLVPRISMVGTDDGQMKEQKFDPVQLSDGTLRIFGILLALYQDPAPSFLVIEEPEQTLHPGALPALAEAFKEASERTQIVVTTHSPHLVDQFDPECIRVAWSEKGLTKISRIRNTQVEAVKQHLMSLQDFMLAEGLQPELDGI